MIGRDHCNDGLTNQLWVRLSWHRVDLHESTTLLTAPWSHGLTTLQFSSSPAHISSSLSSALWSYGIKNTSIFLLLRALLKHKSPRLFALALALALVLAVVHALVLAHLHLHHTHTQTSTTCTCTCTCSCTCTCTCSCACTYTLALSHLHLHHTHTHINHLSTFFCLTQVTSFFIWTHIWVPCLLVQWGNQDEA